MKFLKRIGIDNLKTDSLMYRIYLVSHQDDDKIVPGIDSTGYFLTDSDDFYNSLGYLSQSITTSLNMHQ